MSAIATKTGRNDPCPCQSGKKFKQCCAVTPAIDAVDVTRMLENARYCAYQLGDWSAAEMHYRQVLNLSPNHIEALIGVGQVLLRQHRRKHGLSFLQKAASLVLKRADKFELNALVEQADQLRQWGDMNNALQLYRAVVKRSPKYAGALHGMAGCLQRLHQPDLAMQTAQRLTGYYPQEPAIQLQMALFECDARRYQVAQQRLLDLLQQTSEPRYQARAYLELARIHDKQAHYDDVFPMLEQSWHYAQLQTEHALFDRNVLFNRIEQNLRGFTDELFSRFTSMSFEDDGPPPVFLFGFLRSGTTLIEQVLAAHPQILSSDENSLITDLSEELERVAGIKNDLPAALNALNLAQVQQLRRYYWQRVEEEYGPFARDRIFVNKVALNSIEVGLISCLFPEGKIIFALRDPRDVCLSCAMQAFAPSNATINLLSWQGIARQYAAVMGAWLHFKSLIPMVYHPLRYEDVVLDFERTVTDVLAFLGLAWHEQISQHHKKSQGRYIATPSFADAAKPVYKDALTRWQAYCPAFDSIEPLLSPFIDGFGYR